MNLRSSPQLLTLSFMRSHRGVCVLFVLLIPCGLRAQAAEVPGSDVVLSIVDHQGKWACGAEASANPELALLSARARHTLEAVDRSLASGGYQYAANAWWLYDPEGYFGSHAYWAQRPFPGTEENALTAWPIAPPPPESLRISGFVANAEDTWNGPTFYGPDVAFFLSGEFADQFCFRVVDSDVTPVLAWYYPAVPDGWVGLEFRPEDSGPRNLIRGVLWFDPQSAELRVIEWRYLNLPSWARGPTGGGRWAAGSFAGGRVDLSGLADGAAFPRQWIMKTPVPRVDPDRYTSGIARTLIRGGEVLRVLDTSGEVLVEYRYR